MKKNKCNCYNEKTCEKYFTKKIIKQLIIIRDVELKDKPMMKNRAAYNINLLIEELAKGII